MLLDFERELTILNKIIKTECCLLLSSEKYMDIWSN